MEKLIYASVIIAVVLYTVGFVMLYMYKRDKIKYLEEQLNSLNNMLNSSDQMVDELNNLSDYVTTNIDEKTKDLKSLLVLADEKIKDFKLASNYNLKPQDAKLESHNNSENKSIHSNIENLVNDISSLKKPPFDKVKPITKPFSAVIGAYEENKNLLNNIKIENPKIIEENDQDDEINSKEETKNEQIEKLIKQGLDVTEIAKRLGVGKGEIELILGLKK